MSALHLVGKPAKLTPREYAALLPHPAKDANKYSRGCLLVVGGSEAYPGAPVLAAKAAARAGAGYVRLACPKSAAPAARAHLLSIPVSACAEEDGAFAACSFDDVAAAGTKADALLIGPGMTATQGTENFFISLLAAGVTCPIVFDADGLNLLARHPEFLTFRQIDAPVVLTPHEGEARRLHDVCCMGTFEEKSREEIAAELSVSYNATVVLKGPQTIIASDGGKLLNACGNAGPELAKAGTGDVLAGIIAALVAQGMLAHDAACLGVYLHGKAGRFAAKRLTDIAVLPEDVIDCLGPAMLGMKE